MKCIPPRWGYFFVAAATISLYALLCGCSGGSSTSTITPVVAAPSGPQPSIDCTDCWPTYAHDYQRVGFQPTKTGIDENNVAKLGPRWALALNEQVVVSPVIDGGLVLIGTGAGNVWALNDATGSVVWKHALSGPILETPTIDHGVVYVGTHHAPSDFFALDLKTGNVIWQTSIPGVFRGPAAVANGIVYVGEAGGDAPPCDAGGLHAYEAATGAQVFFWQTDPKPQDGGGVWSPITVDGANILFGTGNTCSNGVPNGNSLMRLTTSGEQEWEVPSGTATEIDDDWGGGITVSGGRYYVANKNGYFYSLDPTTGAIIWKQTLSAFDTQGSIGTPTTDGSVIIIPSGNLLNGFDANPPTANFTAFSTSGTKLWSSATFGDIDRNYAPIDGSIAYLANDATITAVDIHSGAPLWSYESNGGIAYTGPPIVTSAGVVTADTGGAVIDFLPASTTSAASAARRSISLKRRALYEPYGSVVRNGVSGINHIRF